VVLAAAGIEDGDDRGLQNRQKSESAPKKGHYAFLHTVVPAWRPKPKFLNRKK
jgi:hypothetical protein